MSFPALPGFYSLLFLYIEPVSTIAPAFLAWIFPGAAWFHHQFIPAPLSSQPSLLDPRTQMAVWQLANCYFLVGMISSFLFRALRDLLPHDPATQTKIVRVYLTALAIADVSHVTISVLGLPSHLRTTPQVWNSMAHGNITFTAFLFFVRLAWLAGVGRTSYERPVPQKVKSG